MKWCAYRQKKKTANTKVQAVFFHAENSVSDVRKFHTPGGVGSFDHPNTPTTAHSCFHWFDSLYHSAYNVVKKVKDPAEARSHTTHNNSIKRKVITCPDEQAFLQ